MNTTSHSHYIREVDSFDLASVDKSSTKTTLSLKRTLDGLELSLPVYTAYYDAGTRQYQYKPEVLTLLQKDVALAKVEKDSHRKMEQEQRKSEPTVPSAPAPPAPAQQPANLTVEPLYTWDVKVSVGRKYWATKDKYEIYTSFTTEVKAKTRSEAERIAADKSYTTKSAFLGASISVEPAGTEGAKFRVYNCEATRQ